MVLISLARGFNADLFAILFGSILTVSPGDVWLIVALGAVVGGDLGGFYKQLLAITLNEDLARTSGVPVGALNLLLTVLTALTTVVAMRMVGVLLVSAMIVIPTLTGFALGRSFRQAAAIAIGMALLSVDLGLIAAYYLRLAAGGAIVLAALRSSPRRRSRRRGPAARGRLARDASPRRLALAWPRPRPPPPTGPGAAATPGVPALARGLRGDAGPDGQRAGGRAARIALRVKAADTGERQAGGFQCATPEEIKRHLILFDFGREIVTQFHMQNVPAALDIAFVKEDGRIFAILRMEPSPTDAVRAPRILPLRGRGPRRVLREPGHPSGRSAAGAAPGPLSRRPVHGRHTHGSRHKRRLLAVFGADLRVPRRRGGGRALDRQPLAPGRRHPHAGGRGRRAPEPARGLVRRAPGHAGKTYGYYRVEILAALVNGVVLCVMAIAILVTPTSDSGSRRTCRAARSWWWPCWGSS